MEMGRRMPAMPTAENSNKETRIYSIVVGTLMVILIAYGALQLTGLLR
jgi:hypothetical protein